MAHSITDVYGITYNMWEVAWQTFFFFFLLLKAFIFHYTFPCLTVTTSYIIHTYMFSPSLLMTSGLGNIQWRWVPIALISCCNSRFLNASNFMPQWLFNPHVFNILWIESLVPSESLGLSLFRFQIQFFSPACCFSLPLTEVGYRIWSRALRDYSPKSWKVDE